MKKIGVLVADDHSLVRLGLKSMFESQSDMCVVGEAENGARAIELARELRPDVVVMDLMMPVVSGAEATERILAENPSVKVVVNTSYGDSVDLVRAIRSGAVGAMPKESPTDDLLAAIRTVASGGRAIHAELQRLVDEEPAVPKLTERQSDILSAVVRGLSNKDIAKQLAITPDSVKKHLSVVFAKIGAASRAEAAAIALRRQLLKL